VNFVRGGYDARMPTSRLPPPDPFSHPALSESVRALARRGVVHNYRKGMVLIQEGDIGDTIFIVLSGRLRAYSTSADGRREITYGTYGPGEYVGEMGLDGDRRSANVETLEASVCATIARPTLQAHLAEEPGFAFELLSKVIRLARSATLSARQMALNDVYGRLRLLLLSMAVAEDDGSFVTTERLTQKEFASRVGCGREMIARVLGDLIEGGYVTMEPDRRLRWKQLPARW